MICLADVRCTGIIPAVRRVIAQGFHVNIVAFIDHDDVVVASRR